MGLEDVKKGLKKEIDSACSGILKEAEAEKKRIMASSAEEIESFRKDSELKADVLLRMIEKREIASANITAKKYMLNVKKEMIDRVFDEALDRLRKMPEQERKKVISSLIKQAEGFIKVGTVYCSSRDKKLISGYTVRTDDAIDGIICEDREGVTRVDYTYQAMLREIREDSLKEIAAILF